MKYKKRITALIAVCLSACTMALSGCSQESVYVPVTQDTVELTKDGNLIGYLVEDFDKDYYDINELDEMVRSEMEAYNKKNAAMSEKEGRVPIIVDKVSLAEDGSAKAVVALNFANAAVYEDYMDKRIFYGTVAEAVTSGYQLDGKLSKVKDGTKFGTEEIVKNGENPILIVEDTVSIRTAKKIVYLSTNASLTQEGFVDGTSEEFKYIITK